jgi:hypothetical protein
MPKDVSKCADVGAVELAGECACPDDHEWVMNDDK